MKLTRLCKSVESWDDTKCPAMYLDEDPTWMVGQGKTLDRETLAQLLSLADDESGVAVPTETVLRAAAFFLAAHGQPGLAAEIENFLNAWDGGR
jgi:hypothetical protein